ncbi:hypothetical protein EYZ11_007772 [Aspergillus tanneri]|nr:hypothetical protein EYZ11_007772 [Aspergillus tanneri]
MKPRVVLRPAYITTISPFHTCSVRQTLKESDHNREDLANIYEREKQEQLKHSKEGKAKWKQELASNSEASVKADRGDLDDGNDFANMQKQTKDLLNKNGKKSQ